MRPRKYFCATMFVAVCDQNFGNSTSRCSNAGPLLPGISASRVSHSISSNGSRPGIVKYRVGATLASSSRTLLTYSCFFRCLRRLLRGGHAVLPGRVSSHSSRRARGGASCERTGHARTPVGRHEKSAICRKIGPPAHAVSLAVRGAPGPATARHHARRGGRCDEERGERRQHDDGIRHPARVGDPEVVPGSELDRIVERARHRRVGGLDLAETSTASRPSGPSSASRAPSAGRQDAASLLQAAPADRRDCAPGHGRPGPRTPERARSRSARRCTAARPRAAP